MTTARGTGRPPAHGGPQGQGSHGPSSQGPGSHGSFSYPKALAIAVVAIVLGAYLLSLGTGHGAAAPPAVTASPPTTTAGGSSPTSTPTSSPPTTSGTQAKPSTSVTVLVANASHTTGIAGYYTSELAKDGWGTLTATTATTVATTSLVFYASGQQADAGVVATELHLPSSAVKAMGADVAAPVASTTGADVVVVAGLDLAAKVPATATTTTTTAG